MTTKRVVQLVAVLVLGLVAVVAARAYLNAHAKQDAQVQVSTVTRGTVAEEVSATGALQAVTAVQVGSQVSGTIAWLGADFNSIVRKGQVIARLDPSLLESQVSQSRASFARAAAEAESARVQAADAQKKLERIASLFAKGVVAATENDAAQLALRNAQAQVKSSDAQVMQARASLEQAEANLARVVIASPIDGIVTQRSVDVGQTVSASTSSPTLFVIAADLREMQVKAGIDESDIGRIRPAQPVSFQVDAYPGKSFAGSVRQVRLEPTLLQNVITYSVIIDTANPDLVLKPGMTANVKIEIAKEENAIRVPNNALRFRPSAETYALLGQSPAPAVSARARSVSSDAKPAHLVDVGLKPDVTRGTAGTTEGTAGTIDALFAPLTPTESDGVVWVNGEDGLKAVPVRLGLSNGQASVLLEGELEEGDELVTNVTAPGATVRSTPAASGGIFMPAGGGRQGGGRIG